MPVLGPALARHGALLVATLIAGCSGTTGPDLSRGDLAIFGLDTGHPVVVDSRQGTILGEIRQAVSMRQVLNILPSPDRAYFTAPFTDNRSRLSAIDLSTRTVIWEVENELGVAFTLTEALALSSDRQALYVHAIRGSELGVASFDLAARAVTSFVPIPSLSNAGIVALTRGGGRTVDTLVAAVGNQDSALFIRLAAPAVLGGLRPPPGSRHIFSMAEGVPGRLYVSGDASIGLYDRPTGAYLATVPTQALGELVTTDDGRMVTLPDYGYGGFVPTGVMPILGEGLNTIAVVDLRPLGHPGAPPTAADAVFSSSGEKLYIALGTSAITSGNVPHEKARVVVADTRTGAIERVIDLNAYGGYHKIITLP